MTLNPYIVLGSAVVGLLVGLTGAGGGALMTPMLILLFGVKPSAAISSDLVAAVLMRPVGATVHLRKGTVNLRLVGWMVVGSVPMAFVGAYLLHVLGGSSTQQQHVEVILGVALLVGAAAMVFRYILDRRSGNQRVGIVHSINVRPVPTILIGMIGGVIVGLTSVGSGSLMIVLLLFLYPLLSAGQLVGTDLTQAVPLTAAAAVSGTAWVRSVPTSCPALSSGYRKSSSTIISDPDPTEVSPTITPPIMPIRMVGIGRTLILCTVPIR